MNGDTESVAIAEALLFSNAALAVMHVYSENNLLSLNFNAANAAITHGSTREMDLGDLQRRFRGHAQISKRYGEVIGLQRRVSGYTRWFLSL